MRTFVVFINFILENDVLLIVYVFSNANYEGQFFI